VSPRSSSYPFNASFGATDGEICADSGDVEGIFCTSGWAAVAKVRMYRTLIKEFEVEEGSVLKMDCEV